MTLRGMTLRRDDYVEKMSSAKQRRRVRLDRRLVERETRMSACRPCD